MSEVEVKVVRRGASAARRAARAAPLPDNWRPVRPGMPGGIEYMTKAGAKMTPAGRLIFPRALVEDTVARAARRFVLHGQDA